MGSNYYQIKNLFDKMKFQRDDLFLIGKELEEEFQNSKKEWRMPLSAGMQKIFMMKDSLFLWYTENFYDEIF